MVEYPRPRFKVNAAARLIEAEGKIDILKVSPEGFGKCSDVKERCAAVERRRTAGPEHVTWVDVGWSQRLAMTAFAGHAAKVVAVAGTVNYRLLPTRPAEHERGNGYHGGIGEVLQGGVGPAVQDFRVVVEKLNYTPCYRLDSHIGRGTKAAAHGKPHGTHGRKLRCNLRGGSLGGGVINDQDFALSGHPRADTPQAGPEQVGPVVAGDDHGERR